MNILLVLFLVAQQWTAPFRVSPDTGPDEHPAIVTDCWGGTWVCWYNSGYLWSRSCEADIWSEPILVDSTKCIYPEVTTSSMCRDANRNAVVAWIDTSGCIRLSICAIEKGIWVTSSPDPRIRGENPAITCDTSGNIWCIWTMLDTSGVEYAYLVSHYDGNEWAPPSWLKRIVPGEITYTAGITIDRKGNIWVCYNGHEYIWVQYWNGSDWSSPESIGTCFDHTYPSMCANSSYVWVSWFDSEANMGEGGIFARYYDGVVWSNLIDFPHHFDPPMGWHNSHADVYLDAQGRLWAGWWETQAIYCPNYLIPASSYKEDVWEEISVVDSFIGAWGGYPSITCGPGKVWLVWQSEKEGDWNIYTSWTEITGVEEPIAISISGYAIPLESYPNPFDSFTSISYYLPKRCKVRLTIYNIQGQSVRTLVNGEEKRGLNTVIWEGRDNSGRKVPSGPYFLRLEAHTGLGTREYTATRKLSMMR